MFGERIRQVGVDKGRKGLGRKTKRLEELVRYMISKKWIALEVREIRLCIGKIRQKKVEDDGRSLNRNT